MNNLRIKLLGPSVILTVFCIGVIIYISFQQYFSFKTLADEHTGEFQIELSHFLSNEQRENIELIDFLSNNWGFLDSVSLRNIDKLLDTVMPWHRHKKFNVLNIYDQNANIIACADNPGIFGKSDDLHPFVIQALNESSLLPIVAIYKGQLALISFKRIEGNYGPVGVLAAGSYLDQKKINRISHKYKGVLHLFYKEKKFLSSVEKLSTQQPKLIPLIFSDQIDATMSLTAKVTKYVSKAEKVFWQQLIEIIILFSLASASLIFIIGRMVFSVAIALDKSRTFAEKKAEELEMVNVQLNQEIIERKEVETNLQQAQGELKLRVTTRTSELRESEKKYREVVESIGDMITQVDSKGRFIYVNHSGEIILGLNQKALVGALASQFVHPDDQVISQQWFEKCIQKQVAQASIENRQVNQQTGKLSYMLWTSNFHYDEKGQLTRVDSIAHDITERIQAEEEKKKLEEKLRQAHKMEAIGTLAGGIAHDFNNILAVIFGYAEIAKKDISAESSINKSINAILKAANRAKELVKQILAFSRISEENRIPIQIHIIVKEALKLIRASIPSTIEIEQSIDSHCGNILAEPTKIHQVLMNLCTNAAQAMDVKGSVLKVTLECMQLTKNELLKEPGLSPGPYIKLSVTDDGIGIDQGMIDRIFEPYFTTKEVGKGSGMGLAMVHGIVKSHDGMITVTSNMGKGTTFNVYLPKIETIAKQESEEETETIPTGNERILTVDDEESLLEVTKKTLESLGYQVTAKKSSLEALELFRSQPDVFDLVITDQTMPKMTGVQLAKELIAIQPDIPIILCTGYSSKVDEEKAKAVGIKAFAMKPVRQKKIAEIVRRVLEEKTA